MAKSKGKLLLIQAQGVNPAAPTAYTTISALRSTSFTINEETVDVTDKDGDGWRKLLEGAGISSMSVSGSGIADNGDTQAFMLDAILNKTHVGLKIIREAGDAFTGTFQLASMAFSGEYNAEETFDLTLESAGTVTYTAAP